MAERLKTALEKDQRVRSWAFRAYDVIICENTYNGKAGEKNSVSHSSKRQGKDIDLLAVQHTAGKNDSYYQFHSEEGDRKNISRSTVTCLSYTPEIFLALHNFLDAHNWSVLCFHLNQHDKPVHHILKDYISLSEA